MKQMHAWAATAMVACGAAAVRGDVLLFDKTLVDQGLVQDTQPVYEVFTVTNTSQQAAVLTMSHCHFCEAPVLSKPVLNPGESGTVLLTVETSGRKGRVTASATIGVEGMKDSGVFIEVVADVQPRVWVEPLQLFPRIVRGQEQRAVVGVLGRDRDFKVTKVEPEGLRVASAVVDAGTVQESADTLYKREVVLTFPADLELGPMQGQVRITTNDGSARSIVVTVKGEVVGAITATPPMIAIETTPGAVWGAALEVRSAAGELEILSIGPSQMRDECQSVAVDAWPAGEPGAIGVLVSGMAPERARQWAEVKIEIMARVKGTDEVETIVVPVGMVVRQAP